MKFLLFNMVVGAGLVYLFTASPDDLASLQEKAHNAVDVVSDKVVDTRADVKALVDRVATGPSLDETEPLVKAQQMAEPLSPQETSDSPEPKPVAPERELIRQTIANAETPPAPPPLPQAEQVAQLTPQMPDEARALAQAQESSLPQVNPVQSEEPVLMSARDRHRELGILAEEMESLYLHYSFD